jgi:hypothetical protein
MRKTALKALGLPVLGLPVLGLTLLLSACTATSPPPPKVTISNDAFSSVPLNARRLEIIENWQMPVEAPYIGHLQQPLPSTLVANWASKVLTPAGGSGELILDISRASVTKVKLPKQAGLSNALTDQQDSKVKVEFEAQLMWLQPVGGAQAMMKLSSSHSVTIPESSSANDVQRAVNECLQTAIAGLDSQARAELAKLDNIVLP